MPYSDQKLQGNYNVTLVSVPADVPIGTDPGEFDPNNADWQRISNLALSVPRVLVNYYDQRLTAQLAGELFNAEAAIVFLDEGHNAIEDARFSQISQAEAWIARTAGELADISPYFATGQTQVLGVQARPLQPDPIFFLCRNLTVVLYFGSIAIGRQSANSRIYGVST